MTKQQLLYELIRPSYKTCVNKTLAFSPNMIELIKPHCVKTRKNFSEFTREALLEKYTRESNTKPDYNLIKL